MTKSQIEKSIITDWIYEINKPIFFCVLVLIAIGLFISLTINPGTSRYLNNNLFSYFNIVTAVNIKQHNAIISINFFKLNTYPFYYS